MALPALPDTWLSTAHSFHQAARVLGELNETLLAPLPNFLHLSTSIGTDGVFTRLPGIGTLALDFGRAAIVYTPQAGDPALVDLPGNTQETLQTKVLELLAASGHTITLPPASDPHGEYPADRRLVVDPQIGADYAQALYHVFTATARFRARLFAPMTPVVVWPGHFDLSTLIFTTQDVTEEAPHMNFGFAPFSEGIDRPYLYIYGWPLPDSGYSTLTLPPLVRLDTPGYAGPLVWYDDLVQMGDPAQWIETTFLEVYHAILPLLAK